MKSNRDTENNIYVYLPISKSSETYAMLMDDAERAGIGRHGLSSLIIMRLNEYYRMVARRDQNDANEERPTS